MSSNIIYLSSAGSGKTTQIVEDALLIKDKKVLIVTYTNENCSNIINKIENRNGYLPSNLKVLSWYNFVMRDCARPFQSNVFKERITNFCYEQPSLYLKKDTISYFVTRTNKLYSEHAVRFSLLCNEITPNCVFERLEKNYDYIFFDEIQDIRGYDIDLLKKILQTNIVVNVFGDIRQSTFSTNNNQYNKKYKGFGIIEKFKEWEKEQLVKIVEQNYSYRCNKKICEIADKVFPKYSATQSRSKYEGNVFWGNKCDVNKYISEFNPVILQNTKNDIFEDLKKYEHYNFGECKGCTFNNVLIICTKPFSEFVINGKIPESDESKSKLYVAITRARYNVMFCYKSSLSSNFLNHFQ